MCSQPIIANQRPTRDIPPAPPAPATGIEPPGTMPATDMRPITSPRMPPPADATPPSGPPVGGEGPRAGRALGDPDGGEVQTAVAGDPPAPPGGVPGDEPAAPAPRSRRRRWVIEGAVILVAAVVLAVLLRAFVVQVFYVPSTSMLPTLRPGDRIAVSKLSYHFHSIDRGDIIVFARPPAEHCGGPVVPDLVKRVIGLPGDHISSRGNTVLIDGKPIPQPWLPKGTVLGKPITPMVVPPDHYYVLGDNRARSCDSRYWGTVPRSLVVGKVVAVIWPPSQFHFF